MFLHKKLHRNCKVSSVMKDRWSISQAITHKTISSSKAGNTSKMLKRLSTKQNKSFNPMNVMYFTL